MRPMRPRLRLVLRLAPLVAVVALLAAACTGSGGQPSIGAAGSAGASSGSAPAASALPAASAGGPVSSANPAVGGPAIPVLGTENFYADLLTEVGGSRVSATSLLNNPNTDPHTFEASPQAAAAVADAKLVIVNGLGYDDFMDAPALGIPERQLAR